MIGLVRLAECTVPQPKRLQSKPPLSLESLTFPLVDWFIIHLTISCFLAACLRTHIVKIGNKLAQAVKFLSCSGDRRCRLRISAGTPTLLRF